MTLRRQTIRFIVLVVFLFITQVTSSYDDHLQQALSRTALVTIAVGLKAHKFTVTLIRSFERNAAFDGAFYVFSEDVRYYERLLEGEEFRRSRTLVKLVLIEQDPSHPLVVEGQSRRDRSLKGGERLAMRIKLLKTDIFSLVSDDIRYVLYIDSDIVIGKELRPFLEYCMRAYIDDSEQYSTTLGEPNTDNYAAFFHDIGRTESFYHGGIFFVHRVNSAPLLGEWAHLIKDGGYGRDQPALNATITSLNGEDRIMLLPWGVEHRFYTFIEGAALKPMIAYTLMHCAPHRLTHCGKFNFTHELAREYFARCLHVPYHYTFITHPMYMGWRSAQEFVDAAQAAWIDRKPNERRLLKLEVETLRLPSRLLDVENESKREQQRQSLLTFMNDVLELSQVYRWFCLGDRGLNAYVLEVLKLHSQSLLAFDDLNGRTMTLLREKHLQSCEL